MKRFNGKWFTLVFAIVILAVLVLSISVTRRFETLTDGFEDLRSEWGRVALALENPFRRIDGAIGDDASAEAERWRELRREYQKSSLYEEQSRLIGPLWNSYLSWQRQQPDPLQDATSESLGRFESESRSTVDRFIQVDQRFDQLLSDPLGRLTHRMLLLDYPPRIHPVLQNILAAEEFS